MKNRRTVRLTSQVWYKNRTSSSMKTLAEMPNKKFEGRK